MIALSKIVEFASTLSGGLCSDAEYELRKLQCFAPCEALVTIGDKHYCGGCGCPHWKLAELTDGPLPKLRWRRLKCPRGKPGFHGGATESYNLDLEAVRLFAAMVLEDLPENGAVQQQAVDGLVKMLERGEAGAAIERLGQVIKIGNLRKE